MIAPTDLETRLRVSLADNARHAPPGGPLAERILAEVDAPVLRPRGGWRGWTFPLLAAAAIAAVAFALVGLTNIRFSATDGRAGTHAPSSVVSAPPSTPHSTPPPTPTLSTGPVAKPARSVLVSGRGGFRAVDTSYYGADVIWALGTYYCVASPCRPQEPALAETNNGGRSWHRVTAPAGNVRGVRFANPGTGFAFGPSVFYVTGDGGSHWSRTAGGADAVETLDGTVIRVSRTVASCTADCRFTVSYAPTNGGGWQTARIASVRGNSVQLERAAGTAYLLVRSGVGGRLFHSSDGGSTWTRVPACARLRQVALNVDEVNLLCGDQVLVQANTARARLVAVPTSVSDPQLSAVGAHTLFIAGDRLYRSTDGGASWQAVLAASSDSDLGPPGFESDSVGRWITDGGRTIWTTRDGGQTWTGVAFSH